jgi:hypothetical protein
MMARWQVWVICLLLCLWEGLPFTLVGMKNSLGFQLYAAITVLLSAIAVYEIAVHRIRLSKWDVIPLLFLGYCAFVSCIYSTLISPQPLKAWLPALYTISPLLCIFAMKGIKANSDDCIKALLITGFASSLALAIVQASNSSILDFYIRASAFGSERRIVFFKLEATFALIISTIYLMRYNGIFRYLMHALNVGLCAYNVIFLSESRLAIISYGLACIFCWIFIFRLKRKAITALLAPFAAVPLTIFLIDKFLSKFSSLDDYLSNDMSSSWRKITIDRFSQYFDTTNGLGFGFMSGHPEYNNVIAHTSNFGGVEFGLNNYGMYLDDIGIYAALYQYGYIGLIFVVTMTAVSAMRLMTAYRLGPSYEVVAACGFMMISFLISPIPMNYFTLFYTAHVGGLLWFLASRVDTESGRVR